MTARDDAIEAGAQALHGDECPDDEHDLCDVGAWDRAAAAVVDAVEPIIRADERERLRAQVDALPHGHDEDGTVCMIGYGAGCTCWKRDVLALLGGESGARADEYDRAQNGWGNFLEVDR